MKPTAFVAAAVYFAAGIWAIVHLLVWPYLPSDRLMVELLTILGAGFLLGRSLEALREFLTEVKVENPVDYKAKREYHDDDLNKLAGENSSVMKAYKEPPLPQPPAIEPSAMRLPAASGSPAGSPAAATPEKSEPGGTGIPPNPFA
jgi:hypothetical protein